MGFSEFCNISRYLVRNLSFLKLQQSSTLKRIHQFKLSLARTNVQTKIVGSCQQEPCNFLQKQHASKRTNKEKNTCNISKVAFVALAFNLFGFGKEEETEETPEEKLIQTIKRSILCIQREQYDKAEQMLHLALRMAQDIQSSEGVTYCYDLLANLAMEREQFKKAEKLFADVMQRLMRAGHSDDSSAVLHISAKLAHMAHLQGELDKSALGFEWTLQKIEAKRKESPDDRDIHELLGLTKNWYGRLLLQIGKYLQAKRMFIEALNILTDLYGEGNEEAITIMNNLSVTCVNLDEFEEAKQFLMRALKLVKELKDSRQESILEANLGLVYLREGLTKVAREHCTLAYRMAKKQKNSEGIEQAEHCLDEIRAYVDQN